MKSLYRALFFATMLVPAHSQVYLLTGSPNWLNGWYAATDLFEVEANGDLSLAAKIVPEKLGTQWMSASYDWRKLVILPGLGEDAGPTPNRMIVLDFDRPGVSKSCDLPQLPGQTLTDKWLADLPGAGQSFVGKTSGTETGLYALRLDASTPCSTSVVDAPADALRYVVAQGKAGVASLGTGYGPMFYLHPDGSAFGGIGASIPLGFTIPADLRIGLNPNKIFSRVMADTPQILALSMHQEDQGFRDIAFDKVAHVWRRIPVACDYGDLRVFGGFLALAESHDRTGREQEMPSAGKSEWRPTSTAYGPMIGAIIGGREVQYPGRLHIYDVARNRLFTITTNQADSEILLIDNQTVYYRILNRLYQAAITDTGIQGERLLAKSDIIDDVHWAFLGPSGR